MSIQKTTVSSKVFIANEMFGINRVFFANEVVSIKGGDELI